jgi:hypothetical protein
MSLQWVENTSTTPLVFDLDTKQVLCENRSCCSWSLHDLVHVHRSVRSERALNTSGTVRDELDSTSMDELTLPTAPIKRVRAHQPSAKKVKRNKDARYMNECVQCDIQETRDCSNSMYCQASRTTRDRAGVLFAKDTNCRNRIYVPSAPVLLLFPQLQHIQKTLVLP